ncbi:hypothetical protein UlMin_042906 [Ulmus minor]
MWIMDEEEVEFRTFTDDAWYSVRLLVEEAGATIRVKFCGFNDDNDNVFHVDDFRNVEDLDGFASRFRPLSLQLQDSECSKVVNGLLVCASHYFNQDDLRFFDAVVEGVDRQEHSFEEGEEECTCSYILSWLHGPNTGKYTAEDIGHICRVQFGQELNPIVASFLSKGRKKLGIKPDVELATGLNHKLDFPHHLKEATSSMKWSLSYTWSPNCTIGYPCETKGQDKNTGGDGKGYMVFIDNLEKDLTPATIEEFLRKEVSVSCQASVSPSLNLDICTRGSIFFDSKTIFNKFCDFMEDTKRIIMSSRNRPWVIVGKVPVDEKVRASQRIADGRSSTANELRVVSSRDKDFKRAMKLTDLFKEFSNVKRKLNARLTLEINKVLYQANPGLVLSEDEKLRRGLKINDLLDEFHEHELKLQERFNIEQTKL